MKESEAQKPSYKTWHGAWERLKAERREAWEFDRRGICLSVLLFLTGCIAFAAVFEEEMGILRGQETQFTLNFFGTFVICFLFVQVLKYRYNEFLALLVAFVFIIIVSRANFFPGVVAGVLASVMVFIGGAFNNRSSEGFAFVGFCVIFLAFYILFASAIVAIASVALILVILMIIMFDNMRAFNFFQRAKKFKEKETNIKHDYQETTVARHNCRALLTNLRGLRRSFTLGLAGRRGIGKTALLHYVLRENASYSLTRIESDHELKDLAKVQAERLRYINLFVTTPTELTEHVFLMGLLERLAQAINQALTRLLPSVQPYKAEQMLREKRRLLRFSHRAMFLFLLIAIGISVYHHSNNFRAPMLGLLFSKPDSTATKTPESFKLYTHMRDSLLGELHEQAVPLQDSLAKINALLNPRLSKKSWNSKGEYTGLEKKFFIQMTWDSLKKTIAWPRLDSLRATSLYYEAIMDSIRKVSERYQSISDSVAFLTYGFISKKTSVWLYSGWFWLNSLLLVSVFFVYYWTREGERHFSKRAYSAVSNEIALYERTNVLLERLHFQMSFGESQEEGLAISQSIWQFSRKRSRQVQRQVRPYTTLSLIDEYRDYISDARVYLNEALKMWIPKSTERFQILIAIDELDKILDTEKLHNMLKSMKAIFEIEDVYYILSISEDALETYRLRHVDTKNEIDSAFTHIIPVPPMDANGSLAFYVEHHQNWAADLLPAAIVFGGGVPRDMHRLSQIFGTYTNEINLQQCLERLIKEDISACEDMILLNSHLSDEGKQVWLKILAESGFTSKEKTEELLGKIEAHTVDDFTMINPCGGDKAKEQFHRLRSLIRGVVIKGFIYHTVRSHPSPSMLSSWPQVSELKSFIEHLPKDVSLEGWLAQLEPLRDAIFELSRNPLRVWENLIRAKIV